MDLTIYNQNASEKLGVVDVYNSLIWVRRYNKLGAFELTAPVSNNNLALLLKRTVVQKGKDSELAYINAIDIVQNAKGEATIKCSGLFMSGLLYRRTVLQNGVSLGTLIENNLRGLPIVISSEAYDIGFEQTATDDDGKTVLLTDDFIGQNLGEVIEAVCKMHNLGFRTVTIDGSLTVQVYSGVLRNVGQSENPRCIFSDNYENLLSAEYSDSDVGVCNTVYCRCKIPSGCMPCIPPEYDIIPDDKNEPRFEKCVAVDAETRDVQFTVGDGNGGVTTITKTYVDTAKTLAKMKIEAQKALVPITQNFKGTVDFKLKYRSEYDLGDVVTIRHKGWQKQVDVQISEVTERYDHIKNEIVPTFGEPKKTILDILKKG